MSDDSHAVGGRRGRDLGISEWGGIGYMKRGGQPCDLRRNFEDPSFEGGNDTVIEPSPQKATLC